MEFGGEVGILFENTGCLNDVILNHCNFSENSAYWGGGLSIGGAVIVGFLPLSPDWMHSVVTRLVLPLRGFSRESTVCALL